MLTAFFPWFLYVLAWICSVASIKHGMPFTDALVYFIIIFNGGIQGLWAATGHLFFPAQTAQKIGWQSNGFQVEIGFANLAIGVTGILTYFFQSWSQPLATFIIIYYSGCAYNHIKERVLYKNNAPCNSGPMLYSTIATVVTLLIGVTIKASI